MKTILATVIACSALLFGCAHNTQPTMTPSNNADTTDCTANTCSGGNCSNGWREDKPNCGDHPCDNFDKQAAAERYAYNKGVDFWQWVNSDETRANMQHYYDVSRREGSSLLDALHAAFDKWQEEHQDQNSKDKK